MDEPTPDPQQELRSRAEAMATWLATRTRQVADHATGLASATAEGAGQTKRATKSLISAFQDRMPENKKARKWSQMSDKELMSIYQRSQRLANSKPVLGELHEVRKRKTYAKETPSKLSLNNPPPR